MRWWKRQLPRWSPRRGSESERIIKPETMGSKWSPFWIETSCGRWRASPAWRVCPRSGTREEISLQIIHEAREEPPEEVMSPPSLSLAPSTDRVATRQLSPPWRRDGGGGGGGLLTTQSNLRGALRQKVAGVKNNFCLYAAVLIGKLHLNRIMLKK